MAVASGNQNVTIAGWVPAGPIAKAHVSEEGRSETGMLSGSIGGTNESAASFLAGERSTHERGRSAVGETD